MSQKPNINQHSIKFKNIGLKIQINQFINQLT